MKINRLNLPVNRYGLLDAHCTGNTANEWGHRKDNSK